MSLSHQSRRCGAIALRIREGLHSDAAEEGIDDAEGPRGQRDLAARRSRRGPVLVR